MIEENDKQNGIEDCEYEDSKDKKRASLLRKSFKATGFHLMRIEANKVIISVAPIHFLVL